MATTAARRLFCDTNILIFATDAVSPLNWQALAHFSRNGRPALSWSSAHRFYASILPPRPGYLRLVAEARSPTSSPTTAPSVPGLRSSKTAL